MAMRLIVLGGGSAGPNTGQGCSGYYVERDGTRIVLDLGPGTLPELRRHTDFRTLDAVVISHLHIDHVLDVFALGWALRYNPVPSRPLALWLPPGGLAFLSAAAELLGAVDEFNSVFRAAEYDPQRPLRIGAATITFAPTVHYVPCWAMRVAGPGGHDVVYTADSGPAANLAGFARDAEVLIAMAIRLEPSDEPYSTRGVMTAAEAAELANDAGGKTLVLAHMWEESGFDNYRAQAAARFSGRLELARPGLTFDW